ncbi:MAG TPA: AMP-binding protein [Ilumatobacteraceae bacterium]|nr:AMP-binding protein [Ilumatobacteraceae bacterium]HRB03567.1 AMP-binding protein [Ilumatobacteraceae bacterium]
MPHLVAIDLPGGPSFVDALRREWDAGNAVLPVDRRLPGAARSALLAAMAPSAVVDATGRYALDDGRDVEPGDALVMATSGSTGAAKGVVLTHAAVAASASATTRRLRMTTDDMWLACLPLSHVGGLSVVTRALLTDTPLVVHDGFDAQRVTASVRDGVTAVSLVATALQRVDPSIFRVVVLGGSRPPATLPPHVHTTYGMTETGSGVVYDGWPLSGVDVRIDDDAEVLLRCSMLLRCYRDGSTPIDADGWLHTGDLGRWLPDGRLHIDGRRGDLIITGGENVWPDPVEMLLAQHPGIAEVAIIGMSDPEWGQRVTAFVVTSATPPSLAELRALVTEKMPAFCAPKALHIVDSLPRTALGKVQRHLLSSPSEVVR